VHRLVHKIDNVNLRAISCMLLLKITLAAAASPSLFFPTRSYCDLAMEMYIIILHIVSCQCHKINNWFRTRIHIWRCWKSSGEATKL